MTKNVPYQRSLVIATNTFLHDMFTVLTTRRFKVRECSVHKNPVLLFKELISILRADDTNSENTDSLAFFSFTIFPFSNVDYCHVVGKENPTYLDSYSSE